MSLSEKELASIKFGIEKYQKGDYDEALEIFLPMAEKGNSEVQNFLGVFYANSSWAGKNEATAVDWFIKAAEQGYALAQYNLRDLLTKG